MRTLFYTFMLLLSFLTSCSSPESIVTSPDGQIKLTFRLNDNNQMTYQVTVNDSDFISPSVLGFEAKDGVNLSENFHITGVNFDSKDETWSQPWGENKSIRNHYNEMAILLADNENTKLTLRFRVFDDGLGFRYE